MARAIPLDELPSIGDEQPRRCVVIEYDRTTAHLIAVDERGDVIEERDVPTRQVTEALLVSMYTLVA